MIENFRREEALVQWAPLVKKMARKAYLRSTGMGLSHLSQEDLEQELRIVVIKAIDSFKPELGFKFTTYLHKAIFHELNQFFRGFAKYNQYGLTVSADSMFIGEDGEGDSIWETIPSDEPTPEVVALGQDAEDFLVKSLSARAAFLARVMTNPPKNVQDHFDHYQRAVACARERGENRRAVSRITPAMVGDLVGWTPSETRSAVREIERTVKAYQRG